MAIVSFEWVVAAGVVSLALMLWVIYILRDMQRTVRLTLASFEDKLIQMEDETRRLQHDAQTLRASLQNKVEAQTLHQRLEGLTSLLGLSRIKH